ncbi:hypothetical protein DPMN_117006 [Dreissena polymorpha]|uniref:Uncharacterized protein n=2 Tax=Dreissena polymorpha TaxID=45954 RepID=A0A9D4KP35_DREPO|nr:hypothetical protein DPMN_117006 [Dreissena polymorpha]
MKNAKSNSLCDNRNLVHDHPSNGFVKRHSTPLFTSDPITKRLLETGDTKKGSSSPKQSMTKEKPNAQDKAPEFVIPSRTTPPRSARLTSQGEIAYWIKKTNPTGFYADVVEEADGKPRKPDFMLLERRSKTREEIEALYILKIAN